MRRLISRVVLAGSIALLVTACGAGDRGDAGSSAGSSIDGLPGLGGGGGGGTLTFDGEEIPIASVTCLLEDDTFDVGTFSDNEYRVFMTLNDPVDQVSVQILDPNGLQWFPQGNPPDPAVRDGGTFTSPQLTYFNNADDRTVEASFTVECP